MKRLNSFIFMVLSIISLISCSKKPNIFSLKAINYDSVKIENRGTGKPFNVIQISQPYKIKQFCNILSKSKSINYKDINIKSHKEYFEITMYKKRESTSFDFTITNFSGDIVGWNNDDYYRNDSLFLFIKHNYPTY